MKKRFKGVLAVGLVLMMAVAVTGCTSTSGTAIQMSVFKVTTTEYSGTTYATLNVSVLNDHAGTVRISTSNFLLDDSTGQVNDHTGTAKTAVLDNGDSAIVTITFPIAAGSHPQTLKYFDGTNKAECTV